MKRLAFTLVGAAALTLGACSSSNQDQVNNAELNQANDELNEQANQAAMDAANAEAAALANQQQQVQQATDNASNPSDAEEQNVSGM